MFFLIYLRIKFMFVVNRPPLNPQTLKPSNPQILNIFPIKTHKYIYGYWFTIFMTQENNKTITFEIDKILYKSLKHYAINKETTMVNVVISALKKEIYSEEDEIPK